MLMITDAEIIQQDEEQKITEYTVTGKAQLAGDSIWEYEGPLIFGGRRFCNYRQWLFTAPNLATKLAKGPGAKLWS